VTISIPPEFTRSVVHVGSIAVDGVSLTVAELKGAEVRISIIPHTMENTIFKHYKVGDRVNVEFDIIGKYIERLLHPGKEPRSGPLPYDEQQLREMGY
jgi:riboflavin synthase